MSRILFNTNQVSQILSINHECADIFIDINFVFLIFDNFFFSQFLILKKIYVDKIFILLIS